MKHDELLIGWLEKASHENLSNPNIRELFSLAARRLYELNTELIELRPRAAAWDRIMGTTSAARMASEGTTNESTDTGS